MTTSRIKGLKTNVRSSGSIANAEHFDQVGAQKSLSGSPLSPKEILADSTVETAVRNQDVIRVFNLSASPAFLWVGTFGTAPGTVDVTNGVAVIPQFSEVFYLGVAEDDQSSLAIKSSSSQVQVVVMEP